MNRREFLSFAVKCGYFYAIAGCTTPQIKGKVNIMSHDDLLAYYAAHGVFTTIDGFVCDRGRSDAF